jgi:hypothetical protein
MLLHSTLVPLQSPEHAVDDQLINPQKHVEEYAKIPELSNGATSSGDFMQDQGNTEDLSARFQEDLVAQSLAAESHT